MQQVETLTALTIMSWSRQWKRYNIQVAYLTMNFQNLFSRRKALSKAFSSQMVCYNPSQNTLRLLNPLEKCISSFTESLAGNFIQFFSAIDNFFSARKIGH